jgi:predicted nucleic acid-binding protein
MRDKAVIVNSTPIIALASIGKASLFKELYGKIHIPEAVVNSLCWLKYLKSYLKGIIK